MEKSNCYAQHHHISESLEESVRECSKQIRIQMDENPIDLVVAFAAGYSPEEMDLHLGNIQSASGANTVIGCSCETAIGGATELENEKALSLWAAHWPGASIVPMHLTYERAVDGGAVVGWPEQTNGPWPDDSFMIMLAEPFDFPADVLLEQMNEDRPGTKVAGGMTSGAFQPGQARLVFHDSVKSSGAVAVRISGVPVSAIVSQGCRPIGEPMVITASERNIIQQLGGKSALQQLRDLFRQLPTRDQSMVQSGLHVGRVINEYQDKFSYGDFLIRNVVAIDEELESISIGDYVRTGQTVQFHIRDEESASAELEQMLAVEIQEAPGRSFNSSLIFTCNGRGLNLFSDPHHDAGMIQTKIGSIPSAGFFAAGEIGAVGKQNFMHGFTASVVLFE